jgi:pilus assembly protein CpaB
LTRDQLRLTEWPSAHLPFGALGSFEQAVDRVARRPLAAGEAVLETALFDTGAAGGLLAVISPEHRAVSVKVDSVIGVAGFVTPASWVDVLATLRRVDRKNALPYSKVILQNVRVLAVDQKLEEAKSGEPELVSVVTLEVDPVQAEHLVYAAHEGRLQLAMRSPGDDASVSTRSVGVADVLGERRTATRRAGRLVQVISGSRLTTRRF